MDFHTPLKIITVASVALTGVVEYGWGPYNTSNSTTLVVAGCLAFFSLAWTTIFWTWAAYRVILLPKYLSRLRVLPEPTVRLPAKYGCRTVTDVVQEGRSWWNGFASREYHGMKGAMVLEW
jgi:hypothetical protein